MLQYLDNVVVLSWCLIDDTPHINDIFQVQKLYNPYNNTVSIDNKNEKVFHYSLDCREGHMKKNKSLYVCICQGQKSNEHCLVRGQG